MAFYLGKMGWRKIQRKNSKIEIKNKQKKVPNESDKIY